MPNLTTNIHPGARGWPGAIDSRTTAGRQGSSALPTFANNLGEQALVHAIEVRDLARQLAANGRVAPLTEEDLRKLPLQRLRDLAQTHQVKANAGGDEFSTYDINEAMGHACSGAELARLAAAVRVKVWSSNTDALAALGAKQLRAIGEALDRHQPQGPSAVNGDEFATYDPNAVLG
jgi:hypothetical protein